MPCSSREDELHFACYSQTAFPVYKSVSQKTLCAVTPALHKAVWFLSPGMPVVDFQQYIYISNQEVNTSHFLTLFICISSDRNCPPEQGHPIEPVVLPCSNQRERNKILNSSNNTDFFFNTWLEVETQFHRQVVHLSDKLIHCLNTKSDKKFSYLEHNCFSAAVVQHVWKTQKENKTFFAAKQNEEGMILQTTILHPFSLKYFKTYEQPHWTWSKISSVLVSHLWQQLEKELPSKVFKTRKAYLMLPSPLTPYSPSLQLFLSQWISEPGVVLLKLHSICKT